MIRSIVYALLLAGVMFATGVDACDEDDLTDYTFFKEITFDGPNGFKFVNKKR